MPEPVKILFVCLGNICRSPTAQGVFQEKVAKAGLADQVEVDSAGTAHWHIGKAPDMRSTEAAAQRGVDISHLRARQVTAADFDAFDYVLAMDHSNLSVLHTLQPAESRARLGLFLDYRQKGDTDQVPDPYYGGEDGFQDVLDLIEDASEGLLNEIRPLVPQ